LNSKNDTATTDAPTNAPEEKPLVDSKNDTSKKDAPEKQALLDSKKDTATKDAPRNAPTEAMERHERAVKIPLDEVKNQY